MVRPPVVLVRMVLVAFLTPVRVGFLCVVEVLVSLVEIQPPPQATLLSSTVLPVPFSPFVPTPYLSRL